MSQEPWPCNGEDPCLSSKDRTMGVGEVVLCSHGPSSTVWSENGPCCGTIAYFVGGKRGEDLVQYNMSQTLSIQDNHLAMLICLGFVMRFVLMEEKNLKRKNGLQEFVSGPLLGGEPDENSGRPLNLIHSLSCRTPCRLFIHEVFFGPLDRHLLVWGELEQSLPFRPMRALRLQWTRVYSLVCEVALSVTTCCAIKIINCCVYGVAPLITSHALYRSRKLALPSWSGSHASTCKNSNIFSGSPTPTKCKHVPIL
jgi:hypothetical protein